jgi:amidohydrolase
MTAFEIAKNLSDYLYERPEISGKEFDSSKKIAEILREAGYAVEYPFVKPTAFRAAFKNGEGASVALLAEYDALPEIGHACGHNISGAISVLAALELIQNKDFAGTVYVIGTPAEETEGAKIEMRAAGVFNGIDFAIMLHCYGGGISSPNMDVLCLRCVKFGFKGRAAHSVAAPWEGRNALSAARKFIDLIDARRETFTPDMRANAIITKGGDAPNIICANAEVIVQFRAASEKNLEILSDAINKCARGAALALDCEVEIKKEFADYLNMIRLETAENEIKKIFGELEIKVSEVLPPIGSSDVGNVSYEIPALQPLLAITQQPFALHTPEFARATTGSAAYEALKKGGIAVKKMALKVLNDAGFRKRLKEEFQQRVYGSPK